MIFPQKKKNTNFLGKAIYDTSKLDLLEKVNEVPQKQQFGVQTEQIRTCLGLQQQKKNNNQMVATTCVKTKFSTNTPPTLTPPSEATPDDSRLPVGGEPSDPWQLSIAALH